MLVCCCCCSIMLSVQDRHEKWYSQEQEAVDAAESRVNWQMLLGCWCVLTSKQIVVIVGVNSVGLGRCAAGRLLAEQIWRLLADAVGLRNSPAHRHGVTLQTTTTETSCHYSLQPVRTGADKQGGVMWLTELTKFWFINSAKTISKRGLTVNEASVLINN